MAIFGTGWGNLAATVYFLIYQLCGVSLLRSLPGIPTAAHRIVLGSVAGSVMLHWLPVLYAFESGFGRAAHLAGLITAVAGGIVLPGCVRMLFIHRRNARVLSVSGRKTKRPPGQRFPGEENRDSNRDTLKFCSRGFVPLFVFLLFLWCVLLWTHHLRPAANGSLHTGQCDYGDMNMHLGFVTSIARQGAFPPEYSICPGIPLAYPFLSDSISSSLYQMGASLRWAYSLPMIAAFCQLAWSVWLLAASVLEQTLPAVLACMFFFLNGGFGFVYFLLPKSKGGRTWSELLHGFYVTPTNLTDRNIRWVNLIADMLLPQRATLFGYAVLFGALLLLWTGIRQKKAGAPYRLLFALSGIFGGALPLIHTHSFLIYGLICSSYLTAVLTGPLRPGARAAVWIGFTGLMTVLQQAIRHGALREECLLPAAIGIGGAWASVLLALLLRRWKQAGVRDILGSWGILLVLSLAAALPQLTGFTFRQTAAGGFVRGCFNWGNLGDVYPLFYIKNMGIPLLLAAGGLLFKDPAKTETLHLETLTVFSAPVLPLWLLAELVAFAPNAYDNNKLLYAAYFFLCVEAADVFQRLLRRIRAGKSGINRSRLARGTAFLLIALATCSALLTLAREVISDYELYDPVQTDLAVWVEDHTEPDAVFLTSDRHNNSIAALTGRNIVCGSDAFLYFHGIATAERREEVRQMYENPGGSEALFEKYHVDYICVSPYERASFAVDETTLASRFPIIWQQDNCILYGCGHGHGSSALRSKDFSH